LNSDTTFKQINLVQASPDKINSKSDSDKY
jgi:hypothetical protein